MSKKEQTEDVKPTLRWLVGGLNGWIAIYQEIVGEDASVNQDVLGQLEQANDRIRDIINKHKDVIGMSRDMQSY